MPVGQTPSFMEGDRPTGIDASSDVNGVLKSLISALFSPLGSGNEVASSAAQGQSLDLMTEKVPLCSNFYKVKSIQLHEYEVTFYPDEGISESMKTKMLRPFCDRLGIGFKFDGMRLFTAKPVTKETDGKCLEENETRSFTVRIKGTPKKDTFDITVTVKYVKTVTPGSRVQQQIYNLIIDQIHDSMGLEIMDGSFVDPKTPVKVEQEKLEMWPSYALSIRAHEESPLLCVDVTHKLVHSYTVLQTINRVKRERASARIMRMVVNSLLKDASVVTTFNQKTYQVKHVDFTRNPMKSFHVDGKGKMTYVKYYKRMFGLEIKDPGQPLLHIKPSMDEEEPTGTGYLIPEMCQLTGITDRISSCDRVMQKLRKYLTPDPETQVKYTMQLMKQLEKNPKVQEEILLKWGLDFRNELISLTGRVLFPEFMLFANKALHPAHVQGNFALESVKMLSTVDMDHWVLLVPYQHANLVDNLVKTLQNASAQLGMRIADPKEVIKMVDYRPDTYYRKLKSLPDKWDSLQMVLVALPKGNPALYAEVKSRFTIKAGILSQCLAVEHLSSPELMTMASKLVIQINAKLGGVPWTVQCSDVPERTLVIGIYTTGTKEQSSVGAMVGSVSSKFTKYFSTSFIHYTRPSLLRNMRTGIKHILKAYKEENHAFPEVIIIYREGVNEDQFKYVEDVELPEIWAELNQHYTRRWIQPKLTFVMVNTNPSAKFFTHQTGTEEYGNPPPGTVVDTGVTFCERYNILVDFYMVSHVPSDGMAFPTYYNVFLDESHFPPEIIQRITYKLCHLHFEGPTSIRVPAPCQYARKLAILNETVYDGRRPSHKLNQTLHFL